MLYNNLTPRLRQLKHKIKIAAEVKREFEDRIKFKEFIKTLEDYHLVLLLEYLEYKRRVGE